MIVTVAGCSAVGRRSAPEMTRHGAPQQRWGTTSSSELQEAVNRGYRFDPTSWDAWRSDASQHHPMLRCEAILRSNKPRPLPLTVVTQLSLDRLEALGGLCASYGGPLSAAVHVAVVQEHHAVASSPAAGVAAAAAEAGLTAENAQRIEHAVRSLELLHSTYAYGSLVAKILRD